MTLTDKIYAAKALLPGEDRATDALVGALLAAAEGTILTRAYPYGVPDTVTAFPTQYDNLSILLAVRYFSRMGAEGETAHTENGITRSYASADDADLLKTVIPHARLVL